MGKKLLILDWDTPIVRAASMCQTTYVAKHKESGIEIPTKTQKAFKETIQKEYWGDWEFIHKPLPLQPPKDRTDKTEFKPEWVGMHTVKSEVDRVLRATEAWRYDWKLVVHKEGNHRDEIATITKYKGNRPPKPIFTQAIKEYVVDKYKDNVEYVVGEESDDRVAQYMYEEYRRVGENKPHFNVVLGGVDKDLKQMVGWHYNYDKDSLFWVDTFSAAHQFYIQTIMGDSTDNILGLVQLPQEVKQHFGARAGRGLGEKTALLLLEDCKTPREMLQRVVDLYRIQYPDNWFFVLQENCQLLYLKKTPQDSYNLQEKLEKFQINYEGEVPNYGHK